MMAAALLRAGAVLNDAWARGHALRTLERLRTESREPDAVAHTPGGVGGLLEDQVQTASAALDACEATGESAWLAWAERLMERVWRDYRDPEGGGLFDRAAGPDGEGLLKSRIKPIEDAPTPSANGVAALVCLRLAELTGRDEWRARGRAVLEAFAGRAGQLGLHAATWLLGLDRYLHAPTHLVVVGEPGDPVAERMHRMAHAVYAPRSTVQRLATEAEGRGLPAAVAGMVGRSPGPSGYLCVGPSCSPPADSVEAWGAALSEALGAVRLVTPHLPSLP